MKPNELRVGNWVNHTYKKNGYIDDYSIDKQIVANDIPACLKYSETYNPIPLTEERLVGFKFIKHVAVEPNKIDTFKKIMKIKYWEAELIVFRGCGKDGCHWQMQINGNIITYFDYVHEFQNLVYALTGEDL